jgi:uncharacterized protein YpmS
MSELIRDAFIILAIIILLVLFVALIVMSGAIEPYEDESEDT